jgi:hypothetical protein
MENRLRHPHTSWYCLKKWWETGIYGCSSLPEERQAVTSRDTLPAQVATTNRYRYCFLKRAPQSVLMSPFWPLLTLTDTGPIPHPASSFLTASEHRVRDVDIRRDLGSSGLELTCSSIKQTHQLINNFSLTTETLQRGEQGSLLKGKFPLGCVCVWGGLLLSQFCSAH